MVNYDIEGGEKTEKGRAIRSHSLAWTLVIVFLLSSLISTIGAVKPISPGKPAETWDLTIWIGTKSSQGNPTEDVVLDQPDFLLAEDVACSGGLWNTPVGKGIKGYVSAQVGVYRWFENGEWIGAETCGTYYFAHKEGVNSGDPPTPTYLDEFHHNDSDYSITGVSIGHNIDRLGQNYWWFRLEWGEGPPFDANTQWYHLWALTSKDGNEEGVHPETDPDVWIVKFNNADAMICRFGVDPMNGVPDTYYWKGTASFTVTITRSPHAP